MFTRALSGLEVLQVFDPEAAKKLLQEAGYGPGGKPFPRVTYVYDTNDEHKKVAEQLQAAVRAWIDHQIRSASGDGPTDLHPDLLRLVEAPAFEEVMKRLQGNRWQAARWLGLNRATVRRRLAKYFPSEQGEGDDGDDER